MVLLLKLISIAFVVYGCLLILKPEILKTVFGYFKEGNRIYYGVAVKTAVGIFFILASSACMVPWFVLLVGALAVLSSVVFCFIHKKIVYEMIEAMANSQKKQVYMVGAVILVLGTLLILSA